MKYLSTRGGEDDVSFTSVLLNGLAKDGGLYVPKSFPKFSFKDLKNLSHMNYSDLCYEVTKSFISESDIPHKDYKKICYETYDNKFSENIINIDKLSQSENILNLYHGPTLAFKDFALQLLGNIYDYILKKKKIELTILGATSGDTGSAAIYGCSKSKKIKTFILFPYGKVSEIQRRQMTTFKNKNVFCVAIKGDFDDCQKLVKDFFNYKEKKINLAAVNSINWVRIMGQLVYYFWSYFKVEKNLERISYVVPTGNFGNVYAGYISKKMGLPINKLVVSSNKNDILTRFFETGIMERKETIKTISPSMDIQVSSNFERLLYDYSKSSGLIKKLYRDLGVRGHFSLDSKLLDLMRVSFSYGRLSDKETLISIEKIFKKYRIILDPHTAVGYSIGQAVLDNSEKRIYLATAHYSKFIDTVKKVIDDQVLLPPRILSIMKKKERFDLLKNNLQELMEYVKNKSCSSRQV